MTLTSPGAAAPFVRNVHVWAAPGSTSPLSLAAAVRALASDAWTKAARQRLNEMYVKHTGQSFETITAAVERDKLMSPDEAKTFGLIDEVMAVRPAREDEGARSIQRAAHLRIR